MSCREIKVYLDPCAKQEIHVFEDCFGARHVVQLNLLDSKDHDAILAQEKAAMEERELAFHKAVSRRQAVHGQDVQALIVSGPGPEYDPSCPDCHKKAKS